MAKKKDKDSSSDIRHRLNKEYGKMKEKKAKQRSKQKEKQGKSQCTCDK